MIEFKGSLKRASFPYDWSLSVFYSSRKLRLCTFVVPHVSYEFSEAINDHSVIFAEVDIHKCSLFRHSILHYPRITGRCSFQPWFQLTTNIQIWDNVMRIRPKYLHVGSQATHRRHWARLPPEHFSYTGSISMIANCPSRLPFLFQ